MSQFAQPETYEDLRAALAARHSSLSKRLRQIAEFALENPNDMALETVSVIAERAEVQPSSLIRFAKAFGFSGFTDMQRVFRGRLVAEGPDYRARIRGLSREAVAPSEAELLDDFIDGGVAALKHLRQSVHPDQLDRAIALIAGADTVHIAAQKRAFPVAAYLAYALAQLKRRAMLMDGVGGMFFEQSRTLRPGDVLIAVSFKGYSPDVVQVVREAAEAGLPVVVITDSPLSPLAAHATVALEVEEVQVHAFRSLSASMCLALALVVGVGRESEGG